MKGEKICIKRIILRNYQKILNKVLGISFMCSESVKECYNNLCIIIKNRYPEDAKNYEKYLLKYIGGFN